MSAPRHLRRFTVGRWTCDLLGTPASATQPATIEVRWSPERPASMSLAERREFRRHRDEAIDRVAPMLGGIQPAEVARLLDADSQPVADRAAGPEGERGHWNAKT